MCLQECVDCLFYCIYDCCTAICNSTKDKEESSNKSVPVVESISNT